MPEETLTPKLENLSLLSKKAESAFGFTSKREAESLHKGMTRLVGQLELTSSVIENNYNTIMESADSGNEQSKKLLNFLRQYQKSDVKTKLLERESVSKAEAENFVNLMKGFTESISGLKGELEFNTKSIFDRYTKTIGDTRYGESFRGELVRELTSFLKEQDVQSESLNRISEILESSKKLDESQLNVITDLLDATTDDVKEAKFKNTLDTFNRKMDHSILKQDELVGQLNKGFGGKSLEKSFLENPEVVAMGKNIKGGVVSHLAGMVGLGPLFESFGLSEKIADFKLSDLKSIPKKLRSASDTIKESGGLSGFVKGKLFDKKEEIKNKFDGLDTAVKDFTSTTKELVSSLFPKIAEDMEVTNEKIGERIKEVSEKATKDISDISKTAKQEIQDTADSQNMQGTVESINDQLGSFRKTTDGLSSNIKRSSGLFGKLEGRLSKIGKTPKQFTRSLAPKAGGSGLLGLGGIGTGGLSGIGSKMKGALTTAGTTALAFGKGTLTKIGTGLSAGASKVGGLFSRIGTGAKTLATGAGTRLSGLASKIPGAMSGAGSKIAGFASKVAVPLQALMSGFQFQKGWRGTEGGVEEKSRMAGSRMLAKTFTLGFASEESVQKFNDVMEEGVNFWLDKIMGEDPTRRKQLIEKKKPTATEKNIPSRSFEHVKKEETKEEKNMELVKEIVQRPVIAQVAQAPAESKTPAPPVRQNGIQDTELLLLNSGIFG